MACRVQLTTPLFNRQSGGFIKFLKRNFVSSSGDLSDRSNVFHSLPRPFYVPLFSILLLMALFGGSVDMEDVKATCFSYFVKSKTGSKGETSHKP